MLIMKNISRPDEIERHLTDMLEVGKLYFEDSKLIKAFNSVFEKGKEIAMTTAERLRQEGRKAPWLAPFPRFKWEREKNYHLNIRQYL